MKLNYPQTFFYFFSLPLSLVHPTLPPYPTWPPPHPSYFVSASFLSKANWEPKAWLVLRKMSLWPLTNWLKKTYSQCQKKNNLPVKKRDLMIVVKKALCVWWRKEASLMKRFFLEPKSFPSKTFSDNPLRPVLEFRFRKGLKTKHHKLFIDCENKQR